MNIAKYARCTRRCWDATHEKCTCICGGKNHSVKRNQIDLFIGEIISAVNFRVVRQNDEMVLLKDVGPWDRYMTITNGAEEVVASVARWLGCRRLEYIDSDGKRNQILVRDGKFAGFAPVKQEIFN